VLRHFLLNPDQARRQRGESGFATMGRAMRIRLGAFSTIYANYPQYCVAYESNLAKRVFGDSHELFERGIECCVHALSIAKDGCNMFNG